MRRSSAKAPTRAPESPRATNSEWLERPPQRRALVEELVRANALRACRGLLGRDASTDAELASTCARIAASASSEGWTDSTPIPADLLRRA